MSLLANFAVNLSYSYHFNYQTKQNLIRLWLILLIIILVLANSLIILLFMNDFHWISDGETGGFGQPDNAVVHGEFAAASSTSIAVAGTHVDGFLAAKKIEKNEKNEQEDEDDEPVTEHIPSPPLHFESNVIKILNRLTWFSSSFVCVCVVLQVFSRVFYFKISNYWPPILIAHCLLYTYSTSAFIPLLDHPFSKTILAT